jgi:UDP-GlcNAc:undecaprenyl-phosphate/decaprenyl-phosphate GlcNAc-1-phosphate transferase
MKIYLRQLVKNKVNLDMISSFFNYQIYFLSIILIIYYSFFLKLDFFSKLFNLYDYPDGIRKFHKVKTPLLGGVFLFFALLLYLIVMPNLFDTKYQYFYFYSFKSITSFLACYLCIFLLGFLDDKYSISPDKKLIFLFIICYIYVISDSTVRINEIRLDFLNLNIKIEKFSTIFTCIVIVSFFMLSNMFDGINGQSSIFFLYLIIILGIFNHHILNFLIFLALLIFIFLIYNIRSKIFLGDNGIFVLGFVISILYLKTYNIYGNLNFDHLILLTFLPLVDMIKVSITRIFKGKNPMRPDATHVHHLIKDTKSKLIKITFLTISPIILYFLFGNFVISSIFLLLIYAYFIYEKHDNEL